MSEGSMIPPRRLKSREQIIESFLQITPFTKDAPEDKVKSRLLLDVVVRESASVLKLLSGEDQALLVGGDTVKMRRSGRQLCPSVLITSPFLLTPPCPEFWP